MKTKISLAMIEGARWVMTQLEAVWPALKRVTFKVSIKVAVTWDRAKSTSDDQARAPRKAKLVALLSGIYLVARLLVMGPVDRPHESMEVVVSSELFVPDGTELIPLGVSELYEIAGELGTDSQGPEVTMVGLADPGCGDVGTAVSCLGLAEARARTARDWLVAHGVPRDRLSARGAGLFERLDVA